MRAGSRRWSSRRWGEDGIVAPTLTSVASRVAISCARSRSGVSKRAIGWKRSSLPDSPHVERIPDASRSAPTGSSAWARCRAFPRAFVACSSEPMGMITRWHEKQRGASSLAHNKECLLPPLAYMQGLGAGGSW